jgi:hypothetical protein
MSTSAPASVRTGLGSGLRLAPVEVVITRRLLAEMWKITRWFWPAAVVLTTTIGIIIASFTPITKSIWENAGQWPRWWLFAMAIALVATHLPVVVLHGVTRRAAIRALAASGVLISLYWAAFMVAGHVVERFVYARLGWPDTFDTPHLFSDGYDVVPMLAEFALIFLAYQLSGALIGAFYYRFGGIRGTLLLPLGLLPAAAMEVLLATGWYGAGLQEGLSASRPGAALLLLGSAVIVGLTGLAVHQVLRDVPIHGKT